MRRVNYNGRNHKKMICTRKRQMCLKILIICSKGAKLCSKGVKSYPLNIIYICNTLIFDHLQIIHMFERHGIHPFEHNFVPINHNFMPINHNFKPFEHNFSPFKHFVCINRYLPSRKSPLRGPNPT